MENGSKAIIIGGAVLIAILLISLGIVLINSTSGTRKAAEAAPESVAIQTYNQKFEKYLGEQRGARIIDMVAEAIALEADIEIRLDHVNYGRDNSKTLQDCINILDVSKSYVVQGFNYDDNR